MELPFNNIEGGILTLCVELNRIPSYASNNAIEKSLKIQAILFSGRNVNINDIHNKIGDTTIDWKIRYITFAGIPIDRQKS